MNMQVIYLCVLFQVLLSPTTITLSYKTPYFHIVAMFLMFKTQEM
jgi:hypothetical protein